MGKVQPDLVDINLLPTKNGLDFGVHLNVNTGDDTLKVLTGNQEVDVSTGHATLNVSSGNRDVNVRAGGYELKANRVIFRAMEDLTLQCGSGIIKIDAAGNITINGTMVRINS